MKTCSCCRETKELSEFYKNKNRKDGLRYWCKFCSGYKNYLRRHPEAIREDYQAVVDNRALRFAEAPAGLKRCTCCGEPKELSEFYKNKNRKDGLNNYCRFCCNYKNYLRRHPGLTRKDYQAYLDDTVLRFAEAPAGLKRCTCCGEPKALSFFSKDKNSKDGLACWCKECVNPGSTARAKEREDIRKAGKKKCSKCGLILDFNCFSKDKSWCKECLCPGSTDRAKEREDIYKAGKKKCPKCGLILDFNCFSKDKSSKDGLVCWCKECQRKNSLYGLQAINTMARKNKELGVPFNITLEEYQKWWFNTPDVCSYCGIGEEEYVRLRDFVLAYDGCLKFKVILGTASCRKICTMTRDRYDNSLGYTIDNLRKSCWFCNCVKGAFLTGKQTTAVMVPAIEELRSDYERENRKVG